jgi:hypothetical protein
MIKILVFIFLMFSTASSSSPILCHDLPNDQFVKFDPSCAFGGMGCNAGGQGQLCRFCGFGEFKATVPC